MAKRRPAKTSVVTEDVINPQPEDNHQPVTVDVPPEQPVEQPAEVKKGGVSLNRVYLVGNLGKDPDLRISEKGRAFVRMSLATHATWMDNRGTPMQRTDWHNIVVWNGAAVNCHKYLVKGSQVLVEGSLRTREYEDEGVRKWITEVVARRVQFLSRERLVEELPEVFVEEHEVPA